VAKKRKEEKEQGGKSSAAGECKHLNWDGRCLTVRGYKSLLQCTKCVGLIVELWD
jgi:hypothetical protein